MVAECQGGGGGGGDLLIKLFGKTIPVPEPESGDDKDLEQSSSSSSSTTGQDQDAHAPKNAQPDTSDASPQPQVVDAEDTKSSSLSPPKNQTHDQNQKPDHGDDIVGDATACAGQMREKLKKPDKVLPCPRCSSMDTKFCYFNNYNVNQPRHFCKNCQRYWTAGGAMRNVPVGAGRRKNKNAAASHFLLHRVRACDTTNATNGTVLSFSGGHHGPPVCLDLAEQLSHLASSVRNRNAPPGPACSEGSSNRDRDRDDERCSVVDEAAAGAAAKGDGVVQVHHHPAAAASMNSTGAAVWPSPYSCAPSPAAAAYFSSGIAIPIYPAAAAPAGYWGCMVPGAWSLPWPTVQQQQLPSLQSSATTTASSAPSAAVSSSSGAAADTLVLGLGLGKHPRDREGDDGGRREHGKVWAPKTIRIDDVDEVARSSIWSLIGINSKGDKTKQQLDDAPQKQKQQLGMVFEPKCEASKKAMISTSSPLMHTNPVALARSVAFQEGS